MNNSIDIKIAQAIAKRGLHTTSLKTNQREGMGYMFINEEMGRGLIVGQDGGILQFVTQDQSPDAAWDEYAKGNRERPDILQTLRIDPTTIQADLSEPDTYAQPRNGLRYVGWFCDLKHGDIHFPNLRDVMNKVHPENREKVAAYLDRGGVVAETLTELHDAYKPHDHPNLGPLRTLTDGKFVWPSDYAHYVKAYGVEVPEDFMRQINDHPSYSLAPRQLDEVIDKVYS